MESIWPFETVNTLQAAERQLNVAIRMFFERKDLIAVHTLAAASQDVLRKLGKPRGFGSTYYERFAQAIPPEQFKEIFRKPQNFFKHAAREDPEESMDFYYGMTMYVIGDAASLCEHLTGHPTPETDVFLHWFELKLIEIIKRDDPVFKDAIAFAPYNTNHYELPLKLIDAKKQKAE